MRFLNPQFLYGLLALAIPIIVHLFHFRKVRKVYFSNTRFLRKIKEESARRRRLKHYLILMSRLSFVFFLVMAFAQPFIPASDDEATGLPAVIYLDNSYSMSNQVEEDLSARDQGIEYINALLDVMPENARLRLLTNDFNPSSNRPRSKNEIREELTELRFSGIARNREEVINRIRTYEEEQKKNIFWISDFQTSGISGQHPVLFDSLEHTQLIPMKFMSLANISVDSVYLDNPLMIGDGQLRLFVVVQNSGEKTVEDLIIKVYLDEVQTATGSINVSAGGHSTIPFDLSVSLTTNQRGRISIEDFPVTFDNDFYFSLSKPKRITVFEIKEVEEITPVEQVYANRVLFDFTSATSANVDYNKIGNADLVILNGLKTIDGPLITALNRYSSDGGSVLLVPPAQPDLDAYRRLTGAGDLEPIDSADQIPLAIPDFNNPFFENIFEEKNNRMAMPSSRPVLHWNNRGIHLLEFSNNEPYLTFREAQGTLYLVSSPFQTEYDNFIRHALFVPVMYKIAANSLHHDRTLYRSMDQTTFAVLKDTLSVEGLYRLERGETEIVPQQRISKEDVYLDVPPNLLQAGFYDLTLEHNKLRLLAFNYPPEESDLRQASEETIRDWFQGPDVRLMGPENTTDFKKDMKDRFLGKNLWKLMIVLALLALLAEVALIRFMS